MLLVDDRNVLKYYWPVMNVRLILLVGGGIGSMLNVFTILWKLYCFRNNHERLSPRYDGWHNRSSGPLTAVSLTY